MTMPPIGEREIIIRDDTGGGPPPPGGPPDSDWTPEELEDIADLALTVGEDKARDIVKARRKPKPLGERERITPTQEKKGQLARVLQAQGVTLEPPELNDFYDVLTLEVPPSATWEQYLALPDTVGALYRLWRAKKETVREEEEAVKAKKARVAKEVRDKDLRDKTAALRKTIVDGQFKDALAEAKLQHPGPKNVIEGLKEELQAAWEAANQQQRDEWDSLPPEVQGFIAQPTGIPIDTFVSGLDWARFAEDQGLGDLWQQGEFKGTLQTQVFDPILKGAKTPQEQARANAVVKKLKGDPALLGRFQATQEETPGLTASDWLKGDEAGQIIKGVLNPPPTPQRLAQLQEQALALAGRGMDSLQIARYLNLGSQNTRPDGLPGSDEELRFVRNLPLQEIVAQGIAGRSLEPRVINGETYYPNPNYNPSARDASGASTSPQWVKAMPTTGPFTPGGGITPAGYPGGQGWAYMNQAQRQALQEDIRKAAIPYLERGLQVSALPQALGLTGDALLAFYKAENEGLFEGVRQIGIEERTAAAKLYGESTTARQLAAFGANQGLLSPEEAKSWMAAAGAGATGVLEQVKASLARASERKGLEAHSISALQSALVGMEAEASGGALQWLEGFQTATPNSSSPYYGLAEGVKGLLGRSGGREYLGASLEGLALQYVQEIQQKITSQQAPARWVEGEPGSGGWWEGGPSESIVVPPTFRNYIQPYIPQIAGGFEEIYKKNQAAFNDPEFSEEYKLAAQRLTSEAARQRASNPAFDVGAYVQKGLAALPGQYSAQKERVKAARPVYQHGVI